MNRRRQGIDYLSMGDYEHAQEAFAAWFKENPCDYYVHDLIISAAYNRFSPEYARQEVNDFYRDTTRLAEDESLRRFIDAEHHLYSDKPEAALLLFEEIRPFCERDTSFLWCLAKALMRAGKPAEGRRTLDESLKADPQFLPSLALYLDHLMEVGRFDLVLEHFPNPCPLPSEVIPKFLNGPKDYQRLCEHQAAGLALKDVVGEFKQGNSHLAARKAWRLLCVNRDNLSILQTMLVLLKGIDWLERRGDRFDELYANKEGLKAYARAWIASYLGNTEDALTYVNQALEEDLSHFLVDFLLARIQKDLGRELEAEELLLKASEAAPWFAPARAELAEIFYSHDRYSEVLQVSRCDEAEMVAVSDFEISAPASRAKLQALRLRALLGSGDLKGARQELKSHRIEDHEGRISLAEAFVHLESADLRQAEMAMELVLSGEWRTLASCDEADWKRLETHHHRFEKHPFLHLAYALHPAFRENLKSAQSRLNDLVEAHPKFPLGAYHRANVAWLLDQKVAVSYARRAQTLSPLSVETLDLLCDILEENGKVTDLERLRAEYPDSIPPIMCLLRLYVDKKKQREAEVVARQILQLDLHTVVPLVHLMAFVDKESEEFVQLADQLSQRIWLDFDSRYFVARKMLFSGQTEAAKERLTSLIEDGYASLPGILLWGLSQLGTSENQRESARVSKTSRKAGLKKAPRGKKR